jgi:hypothetical protein
LDLAWQLFLPLRNAQQRLAFHRLQGVMRFGSSDANGTGDLAVRFLRQQFTDKFGKIRF